MTARYHPVSNLSPWVLALVIFCQPVAGVEPGSDSDSSLDSVKAASQPESVEQPKSRISDTRSTAPHITSLLVDKEIPVLGGKWGAEIFVDAPLNGEPADASITLRRAKLKYSRSLGNNWQFKLSADYKSNAGLELSDSYIVFRGWRRALLTFGVKDPPFSLESVSTSSSQTFMEKALAVTALSERKGGGLGYLRRTPKSILNADLVFFTPKRDNLSESGQALVLHYVHSPIRVRNRDNIHLGGSLSYRLNADENNTRYRSRPEIGATNTYFVDTGTISRADKIIRASLEASRVDGRFSWQTELLSTKVERIGFDDVRFWGAYAYISWFLTNDSRNYNAGVGQFEALKPASSLFKGGRGAFELAFRASYVDLTDKDVIGGEESNLSLGFNWYLNYKLRVMANVIKVLDVQRPGSEYDGQAPLIFALRAQWLMN